MKTVTINLYELEELDEKAYNFALEEILMYTNEQFGADDEDEDDEYYEYTIEKDKQVLVDFIKANCMLFYKDGSEAALTNYTGKHEKSGTIELELGGEIYNIT